MLPPTPPRALCAHRPPAVAGCARGCATPLRLALLIGLCLLWSLMSGWGLAHAANGGNAEAPDSHTTLTLTRALSAEYDGPHFPAAGSKVPIQAVPLPDDWALSRPAARGPVWYRVEFVRSPASARPSPETLLALQIPHACSVLQVQLNGQPVHSSGPGTDTQDEDCGHPLLVPLPVALMQPGSNRLDLQVSGIPLAEVGSRHRAASLSALTLGPLYELQARQRQQTLLKVTLPLALSATLLLMGGFMFMLGFFNRRESHLAYFGALSVGWSLLNLRLWRHDWPLPADTLELMLCALLPLLTLVSVQFLLRYAGVRQRWLDRALPMQTLGLLLILLAAGPAWRYTLTLGLAAVLVLQVLAAAVVYLQRQGGDRSVSFWLMGSLLAVTLVSAAIEWMAQSHATPPPALLLARLAMPLMLVVVGLRLVQQYGRALQQAEISKAVLEQKVREATAEVERNFRQLSELRIEQVTERERKRIAADLHDDLGAKLLTIVHTSESDRISTLAREALEEMRLSVRGLTGRAVRLADALGDWRAEVVSRLAQAGIEADWSAPEDLPQTLSARAYVQTTRILREATSNIIKHSGASFCSVSCQVADGDFQLVVQDNGEGIVSEPDGRLDRGHGMATMKQRAKQLQGQCLVESGPGFGTVIRLTLPLDRALEGA